MKRHPLAAALAGQVRHDEPHVAHLVLHAARDRGHQRDQLVGAEPVAARLPHLAGEEALAAIGQPRAVDQEAATRLADRDAGAVTDDAELGAATDHAGHGHDERDERAPAHRSSVCIGRRAPTTTTCPRTRRR
jgi:hypothetical protein